MATSFLNNLSNTYRGSPSLQNQFATEQDYLDLFDNNQVTPAMAQAYVPTNDTTGIKSITNTATPIINTGGDGGDGPPGAPPGNPSFDYETEAYGLNNMTPEEKGITEAEQKGLDKEKNKNTAMGLMAALSFAFNPIGFFIGRYAKDKYNAYKEKKAAEEKAASDKNKAEIDVIQARIDKEYKDSIPGGNFDVSGPDTTGNPTGKSNRASQERGHQMHGDRRMAMGGFISYGGKSGTPRYKRASYFDGGIVSLRRR